MAEIVQRRDAGTKASVNNRTVVKTLEDSNRYQMPPSRRLYVQADQQAMPMVAETSGLTKLAEGLAKVKPEILDYLSDQKIKKNKEDIQKGITDRNSGKTIEEVDGTWNKFGYEQQSSYLAGEDLGKKLEIDSSLRDPDEPFNDWYKNWYAENGAAAPKNPEHLDSFNKSFTKSLTLASDTDQVKLAGIELEKRMSTSTEIINRVFHDLKKANRPIDNEVWQYIKNDQQLLNRWSNPQMDELQWRALSQYVDDTNDLSAMEIFRQPRGANGEIPALIHSEEWAKKINALEDKVIARTIAEENRRLAAAAKETARRKVITTENKKTIDAVVGYNSSFNLGIGTKDSAKSYQRAYQAKEKYDGFLATLIDDETAELTYDQASGLALNHTKEWADTMGWIDPAHDEIVQEQEKARTISSEAFKKLATPNGLDIITDHVVNGTPLLLPINDYHLSILKAKAANNEVTKRLKAREAELGNTVDSVQPAIMDINNVSRNSKGLPTIGTSDTVDDQAAIVEEIKTSLGVKDTNDELIKQQQNLSK